MKRIGCILLAFVAVVSVTATAHPGAGSAPRPSSVAQGATVVAAIDLPSLFGNENEPDENEPDENDGSRPPHKAAHPQRGRSIGGVPLKVALPVLAIVLALGAITALVVRWVRRYRAWKRRMSFRMRAGIRRLADDLEQVRRRGLRP